MSFQLHEYETAAAIRAFWDPEQVAARIAQDRADAREIAGGIACPEPDCGAQAGQPCFGEDARCTHQSRAIAYYDRRLWARVRREQAEQVAA